MKRRGAPRLLLCCLILASGPALGLDPVKQLAEFCRSSAKQALVHSLTDAELEKLIEASFPGPLKIKAGKLEVDELGRPQSGQQETYQIALLEYLSRHADDPRFSRSVIRSYGDLLSSGLFELKNGELQTRVVLQGTNLSAFRVDLSSPGPGLAVTGFNGATTYFRDPGEKRNLFTMEGYVGKTPSLHDTSALYGQLGCFGAIVPGKFPGGPGDPARPGWERYISDYEDFAKAEPRVFWLHPDFKALLKADRQKKVAGKPTSFDAWVKSKAVE